MTYGSLRLFPFPSVSAPFPNNEDYLDARPLAQSGVLASFRRLLAYTRHFERYQDFSPMVTPCCETIVAMQWSSIEKLGIIRLVLLGAAWFWLPDLLLHAFRRYEFNRWDVRVLTVVMPLTFLVAFALQGDESQARSVP